MATLRLPGTVLRSFGACPCTSALGLRTRRYSALKSKRSPLSNAMVSVLRSLCSRSSVGHGCETSFIGALRLTFAHVSKSNDRIHAGAGQLPLPSGQRVGVRGRAPNAELVARPPA